MTFKAPKGITSHPGVQEVDDGIEGGAECRYDVILKEGWHFFGLDNVTEPGDSQRRMAFFDTVAEFKAALPMRWDDHKNSQQQEHDTMQTTEYTIIRANGDEEVHSVQLPAEPDYFQLKAIIQPIIGERNNFERVNVLHNDQYTDMFVDEIGPLKGLPLNATATAIYRANWIKQHPKVDPDSLPPIVGTAVLFARRVWF